MPSAAELFGTDRHGRALVSLRNEEDQPQQDIVLPRCYRNPPWTLVTAHGVGFGINRIPLVQMFPDPSLWRRLGYATVSGDLSYDKDVILERNQKSIPEFFARLLTPEDTLYVKTHENASDQYRWMAEEIKRLIEEDELDHSEHLDRNPKCETEPQHKWHHLECSADCRTPRTCARSDVV